MFDILKKKNSIKSSFKAIAARKYLTKTKYLGSWLPYTCIKGIWGVTIYLLSFLLTSLNDFPNPNLNIYIIIFIIDGYAASNETDNY